MRPQKRRQLARAEAPPLQGLSAFRPRDSLRHLLDTCTGCAQFFFLTDHPVPQHSLSAEIWLDASSLIVFKINIPGEIRKVACADLG